MSLRKAAEMALARLEHTIAYSNEEMAKIDEAKHALRQALAQPKREWVGLTDDDVHDAFNYVEMVKLLDFDRDRPEWCEAFASACEARLRHKNGGNK